jgi:hypothetical protein
MLIRAAGDQPRRWRGVVGPALPSRSRGCPAVFAVSREAELGGGEEARCGRVLKVLKISG